MMQRVCSLIFLGFLLTTQNAQAELEYGVVAFDSKIVPKAQQQEQLDGVIYYKILRPYSPNKRPLKTCFLMHGHGFSQKTVDRLVGKTVRFPRLRRILPVSVFDSFVNSYFGEPFVQDLGANACQEIYVLLRESVNTSIHEMVLQTENLVKTICGGETKRGVSGQRDCALVGHSKSGAVVTSIVRRCMDKISKLGESGCQNISEAYSAAGVNLGSGVSAILLGAKVADQSEALPSMDSILGIGASFLLNGAEQGFSGSLLGDRGPGLNPLWADLGPISSLEENKTLYGQHYNFFPVHTGWWKGDYAASAGGIKYSGLEHETIGSGTLALPGIEAPYTILQNAAYEAFSFAVGNLHFNQLRGLYDSGIEEFEHLSPSFAEYGHPEFTWDSYQESDGYVERISALQPCLNGLEMESSSVTDCSFLPNIHHLALAGAAREAATLMVTQLRIQGRVAR